MTSQGAQGPGLAPKVQHIGVSYGRAADVCFRKIKVGLVCLILYGEDVGLYQDSLNHQAGDSLVGLEEALWATLAFFIEMKERVNTWSRQHSRVVVLLCEPLLFQLRVCVCMYVEHVWSGVDTGSGHHWDL